MKVLITGGAGYIGSTIASACIDNGITPVILDNLVTGPGEFLAGRVGYEGDIADGAVVDTIFAEHPDIHAVIHCAALIVVPESTADPLRYYRENVAATVAFAGHVVRNKVTRFLFASSASVYGSSSTVATETDVLGPSSPYAQTKAVCEAFLSDMAAATGLRTVALRYANPIGTDPQLRTGLQIDKPTHLLGRLITAAEDNIPFTITGTGWPTRDGSGLRDYIHVWDLAEAHVAALKRFDEITNGEPYQVMNLSTGTGTTVRELAQAFIDVTGHKLEILEAETRPGDVAGFSLDNSRAVNALGWTPKLSIQEAIQHAMEWRPVRAKTIG